MWLTKTDPSVLASVASNEQQIRLESMTEEVGALHEAMAGLHGEMGAVQRELDGAKASQDKLITGACAGEEGAPA